MHKWGNWVQGSFMPCLFKQWSGWVRIQSQAIWLGGMAFLLYNSVEPQSCCVLFLFALRLYPFREILSNYRVWESLVIVLCVILPSAWYIMGLILFHFTFRFFRDYFLYNKYVKCLCGTMWSLQSQKNLVSDLGTLFHHVLSLHVRLDNWTCIV